jgi:SAM-dependent methyltransferase
MLDPADPFLRALDPVVEHARQAAGDEPVRVADLGCGNAYLSFAGFQWLAGQHIPAELTGVDVKAQARMRNTQLAAELGWADDVTFVEAAIDRVQLDREPHIVLALHACDTATDDALARAVEWTAPVILAAPCCHHDLQQQLRRTGEAPEPYGLLARHGILRERFADVLTDSLRAAILRIMGYRVEVIEFVDSAHTPRNVLIRAVRTGAPAAPATVAEYRRLTQQWGVAPALAERLGARFELALKAMTAS